MLLAVLLSTYMPCQRSSGMGYAACHRSIQGNITGVSDHCLSCSAILTSRLLHRAEEFLVSTCLSSGYLTGQHRWYQCHYWGSTRCHSSQAGMLLSCSIQCCTTTYFCSVVCNNARHKLMPAVSRGHHPLQKSKPTWYHSTFFSVQLQVP